MPYGASLSTQDCSSGDHRDVGQETLQHLESFEAYAGWIHRKVQPYTGQRILEIGTGIGNNVPFLLSQHTTRLALTDFRQSYVDILHKKYGDYDNIDIYHYDATLMPPDELTRFGADTLVCLNVLEHIEQDRIALSRFYDLLQPGGHCIILVPAFQWLYSQMDKYLEHYRRYNMHELQSKMEEAGFITRQALYFNLIGALGWFFTGKILREKYIKSRHVFLQKLLLPMSYAIDKLSLPLGLSVICVGKKPDSDEG